jgi:quinol monooxygenase YgiN
MSDTVRTALWVPLHAKPGKEAALEEFLKGGLALVRQEPATTAWFAVKFGPSMYGIFDVFPDEAGRQAHLTGAVAKALMANSSELLAEPPKIEKIEVLAAKLPSERVEKAA